ncbi:hypothetical protein CR513_20222, partial [Mucuna pruriens]
MDNLPSFLNNSTLEVLHPNFPISLRRSSTCFLWEIKMPCLEYETFIPRKYFSFPNSFISNYVANFSFRVSFSISSSSVTITSEATSRLGPHKEPVVEGATKQGSPLGGSSRTATFCLEEIVTLGIEAKVGSEAEAFLFIASEGLVGKGGVCLLSMTTSLGPDALESVVVTSFALAAS